MCHISPIDELFVILIDLVLARYVVRYGVVPDSCIHLEIGLWTGDSFLLTVLFKPN